MRSILTATVIALTLGTSSLAFAQWEHRSGGWEHRGGEFREHRGFEGRRFEGERFEGRRFEGRRFEGRRFEGRRFEGRRFEGRRFEGRRFEGRRFEGGEHGRRFWHGRWYNPGIGPCWSWTPVGYVWICG